MMGMFQWYTILSKPLLYKVLGGALYYIYYFYQTRKAIRHKGLWN